MHSKAPRDMVAMRKRPDMSPFLPDSAVVIPPSALARGAAPNTEASATCRGPVRGCGPAPIRLAKDMACSPASHARACSHAAIRPANVHVTLKIGHAEPTVDVLSSDRRRVAIHAKDDQLLTSRPSRAKLSSSETRQCRIACGAAPELNMSGTRHVPAAASKAGHDAHILTVVGRASLQSLGYSRLIP